MVTKSEVHGRLLSFKSSVSFFIVPRYLKRNIPPVGCQQLHHQTKWEEKKFKTISSQMQTKLHDSSESGSLCNVQKGGGQLFEIHASMIFEKITKIEATKNFQ